MCFEFDDDEPVPFYDACQVLPSGDQDDDYEKTFTTLEARRSSPLLGDPSMTPPNVDVKPDGVGPLDSFLSGGTKLKTGAGSAVAPFHLHDSGRELAITYRDFGNLLF